MDIQLRYYQRESVDTFFDKLKQNIKRQLIVLPTGAGKTIVASELAKRFHQEIDNSRPIMFVAHRDELLKQTAEKMSLVWKGVKLGLVKGKNNNQDADLIVCSTSTLVKGRDLVRPSLIIWDECHHAISKSAYAFLDKMGVFKDDGPPILGITATPTRADGKSLDDIFDEIVYKKTILELIVRGYLCDIKGIKVVANELDLLSVDKTSGGDYRQEDLAEAMNSESVNLTVVQAFLEHARDRKTIIFTVSVKQAFEIARLLHEQGINAAAIHSKSNERENILEAFHTNKLQVLVNCTMLSEGFDEPQANCVIIARPTTSDSLYQQMIGRGTRLFPGKENCLILDVVGATNDKSLITLQKMFDPNKKKRRAKKQEDKQLSLFLPENNQHAESLFDNEELVDSVLPDLEMQDNESVLEFQERVQQTLAEQGKRIEEINLFAKTHYSWLKVGDSVFYISMGNYRSLYLIQEDDKWWAIFENNNGTILPLYEDSLNLEYAQGIAESFLHEVENRLIIKEAGWRGLVMTPKQEKLLNDLNVQYEQSWTRGEANDAIDRVFGERKAQKINKKFSPKRTRKMLGLPNYKEHVEKSLFQLRQIIQEENKIAK